MSEIKRFVGFVAPDGTTHKTEKEAQQHVADLKVKEALAAFANPDFLRHRPHLASVDILREEGGELCVPSWALSNFLFDNRHIIMAAYNAGAARKPRKPRADKGKPRGARPTPSGDIVIDSSRLVD